MNRWGQQNDNYNSIVFRNGDTNDEKASSFSEPNNNNNETIEQSCRQHLASDLKFESPSSSQSLGLAPLTISLVLMSLNEP